MATPEQRPENEAAMETKDDADYDLAPTSQKYTPVRTPLVQPAPPAPGEPVTLAYRAPKEDNHGRAEPDVIKNLYMPLWLLAGGVVIEIAAALIRTRSPRLALTHVGVSVLLSTVIMLCGMLLAARFRGIDLGNFWIAVFKLAAISVAPGALVSLVSPLLNHIPFGDLISLLAYFVLYFALLGALFDLDQEDTWYCVCVIFLIRLAVYFTTLWLK